MKLRNLTMLLMLVVSFSVGAVEGASDEFIRSLWMHGYANMEQADKAADAGNVIAAVNLYNEAVKIFADVQRKYPQWHPALQNFRLKYCRDKVRELSKNVDEAIVGMNDDDVRKTLSEQAMELQRLHDEIGQLERKLSVSESALERARAEAAQALAKNNDFDFQQERIRGLESRANLADTQLQQARQEIKRLQQELAAQREQSKNQVALEQSTAQVKELSQQLRTTLSVNEQLEEQVKLLEKQLERSEKRIGEYESKKISAQENAKQQEDELLSQKRDLLDLERELTKWSSRAETLQARVAKLERENQILADSVFEAGGGKESREIQLLQELKRSNEELVAGAMELDEAKSQLLSLRQEADAASQAQAVLQRSYAELEQQFIMMQSDVSVANNRLAEQTKRESEASDEIARLKQKLAEADAEKQEILRLAESRNDMLVALEVQLKEKIENESHLTSQINDLQRENGLQKSEIERLTMMSSGVDAVKGLTDNLAELSSEVEDLRRENSNLKEQLAINEAESVGLADEAASATADIREQLTQSRSQIDVLHQRLEELNAENQLLGTRLKERDAEFASLTASSEGVAIRDKNEIASLVRDKARLEAELDSAKQRYDVIFEEVENLRKVVAKLQTESLEREKLIVSQREQLASALEHQQNQITENGRLKQDNEAVAEALQEMTNGKVMLEAEVADLKNRLGEVLAHNDALEEELRTLNVKSSDYVRQISTLERQLETLRNDLDAANSQVISFENECAELKDEILRQQQNAAFQKSSSDQALSDANRLEDDLNDQLKAAEKKNADIERQLRECQILLAEANDECVKLQDELEMLLKTHDAENKKLKDEIAILQQVAAKSGVASSEEFAQITNLQNEIAGKEQAIAELQANGKSLERQLEVERQNCHSANESLALIRIELEKAASEAKLQRESLEQKNSDLLTELASQQELARDLQVHCSEMTERAEAAERSCGSAEQKLKQNVQQYQRQLEENANLLAQCRSLTEQLDIVVASLEQKKEEVEECRHQIFDFKTQLESECAKNQSMRVDADALRMQIAGLETKCEKLEADTSHFQLLSDALQQQLNESQIEVESQQRKVKALQSELSVKLEMLADNANKINALEEKITELEIDASTAEMAKKRLVSIEQELTLAEDKCRALYDQLNAAEEKNRQILAENQHNSSQQRQLEELRAKLAAEIKKRQDLEILLIQRESNGYVLETERNIQTHSAPMASSQENQDQLSRDQQMLANGFLRQAVDAEKAGSVETARWNYQKTLEINPTNAIALKRLGIIAANSGDDAAAVKYLKQAFANDQDDRDVLLALGYAMIQQGQAEWAIANLARASALAPDDPATQCQFAAALAEMGWREAALKQYEKAYELDPKNPDPPFNLALIYLTMFSDAMKDASEDHENRGAIRAQANKYKRGAKSWYDRAKSCGAAADPELERLLK